MRLRSNFEIVANIPGKVVAIIDSNDGHTSVTNDAEAVIWWLTDRQFLQAGKRCIYRDTDGRWDELTHDGVGKFRGFAPLGAKDQYTALTLVGAAPLR